MEKADDKVTSFDVIAVHQPPYLAWFGLIDKIARADRFVVLDNVQYNSRAFQHRTLYSTDHGPKYLSLSVNSKGHRSQARKIFDMQLLDQTRSATHFTSLRHRYGKRPGWATVGPALEEVMCRPYTSLLSLNMALLELTLDLYAIATPLVLASELQGEGAKSELMLSLTQAAGGRCYLSGQGARDYMDETLFTAKGIDVVYQEFVHPEFSQSHKEDFQKGCFALEWVIEEPDTAAAAFHHHLNVTGAPRPPRNLAPV